MAYSNWLASQLGGPQLPIAGAGAVTKYIGPLSPEKYAGTYKAPISSGNVLGAQAPSYSQQPQQQQNNPNPYQDVSGAVNQQNDAELAGLNTQYDMFAAQAQNQLSDLARSKEQSLASLGTQYQGIQSDVNKQKGYATENQESQIANAGNVARNTQKANRNALRALGILDSSAAGELLTKPMNEFDTQRNDIVMATTKRISELDDFMNQKTSEHTNLVSQLENQYLSMVNNIQTDLRFNGRQRADAIRAVNASLSSKLAEIGMAQQAYQNQVNAQKAQWTTQLAGTQNWTGPSANIPNIASTAVNYQQGQQGANITPTSFTKKYLSPLANAYAGGGVSGY